MLQVTSPVATADGSYTIGASTAVVASGRPVVNATVSVSVTRSNGALGTGTANTDPTGAVVYKLRLGRRDPVGIYQVAAKGSNAGAAVTATTSFTVQ